MRNFTPGVGGLIALLLASGLAGCRTSATAPSGIPGEPIAPTSGAAVPIMIDGDIAEWPSEAAAMADANYLYLRFTVEDEMFALQAAPRTVSIMLDVDGSTGTGDVANDVPLNSLGVDLEVQFSPRGVRGGGAGTGCAVIVRGTGNARMKADALDVVSSPTYAAQWYEVRLSRAAGASMGLPQGGFTGTGTVSGVVVVLGDGGAVEGYADPFSITVDTPAAARPGADQPLPSKPEGAIRVMTYNVEKSAPMGQPDAFRRVFEAMQPDVILLQEWETGDGQALATWFQGVGDAEWHVLKAAGNNANGGGVAIVSRYPLAAMPGGLMTGGPESRPVRFIGAVVKAADRTLVVGSAHLKCCGSAGSPEDVRRMAEARAIAAMMGTSASAYPGAIRVIAGDFNLVGTRPPLDLIRAGIDADGTDLSVVNAPRWGDNAIVTWRDAGSQFPPGRLDYVVWSDANADAANAFVLDTGLLSESALASLGLMPGDTGLSDHLPTVVDVMPR